MDETPKHTVRKRNLISENKLYDFIYLELKNMELTWEESV
jgi:hypothetical protein